MNNINFDETKQSQLPLAEMLVNMGYRYIPSREVMAERKGDTSKFILRDTAQRKLREINSYEHNGNVVKFSDKEVSEVIDELENIPNEGLIDTSKKVFGMIMPKTGGKTVKVFLEGKTESKSFKYIDFENPDNNDFAFTVEFEASGKENIRVDIAIFVNGIPFALIENKKSSEGMELAISQHLRNQGPNYCPKLFVYPQLLIGANKEDLRYGTTGTPFKFYAKWTERDIRDEEWKYREEFDKQYANEVAGIISKPIAIDEYEKILNDLNGSTSGHKQAVDRLVTQQDLGVYGLFRKSRFLDITKNFILYDAGIKKVMRYQQFYAIKKMISRVDQKETHKQGERRRGGILWQTQGSGKSLTMVMFVKALIEDPHIKNPRVIIVTDRKDLDRQIKGTFLNAGLKKDVIQARSGQHLLGLIKQKDLRVITTLVHKFESANKGAKVVDLDQNIFVLIDEAHRSQHGLANIEMNRAIPNACYIGFTGTPLLKKDKSILKFGSFIDRYTIDDALSDQIILPLIYEGRYVDLRQDTKEVDKQIDRLTNELKEPQKKYLQGQVKSRIIMDNPQRIAEIAYDIEKHFLKQFKNTGLKAQIVAPSKYSATLFQKYFLESGQINTALVISDENGIIPEGDQHKQEVDAYLKDIKSNYQSLLSYEKEVIDSFKYNDEGVEILIVVDKLLTGFDAPRNTVLYLAKELRDHGLLQAIARVNRLFENETFPKNAGYIIDYSENAMNLKSAMQLFGNYDQEDVESALVDVSEKIEELESAYAGLHDIFNGISKDDEAYIQFLSDETKRHGFYDALNTFLKIFSECTVLQEFTSEFDHIDMYQMEMKKFMNLRKTTSFRYADQIDFSKYERALIKILDKNINAEEAELLTKQISINDKKVFEEALKELGSDRSKAEAITTQLEATISETFEKDPEFYQRFSVKIAKLLEEMRQKKIADIEALKQARLIQEQVLNKEDDTLPISVSKTKGADTLFRNLKENFEKYNIEPSQLVDIVFDILHIIEKKAIVDWYLNSEQIRIMSNSLDDYFYDIVRLQKEIYLSSEDRQEIIHKVIELAKSNHEDF